MIEQSELLSLREVTHINYQLEDFSPDQISQVKEMAVLIHLSKEDDKRIWPFTDSKNFSLKSYYKLKKHDGQPHPISSTHATLGPN